MKSRGPLASKTSHQKLNIPDISISNEQISPTNEAKNIGFMFDHLMNCQKLISLTCKSGWFHFRNIGKIHQFLDNKSTDRLIHAYVSSTLDINNSLLHSLPDILLNKLQVLQNAAAQLVMRLPKYCHDRN